MNNNFDKLIAEETAYITERFANVLQKGAFHLSKQHILAITFVSADRTLIFVYENNRYLTGKHMSLEDIIFSKGGEARTIEELIRAEHPTFNLREHTKAQRTLGISKAECFRDLIDSFLLDVIAP